jgi:hypothetical protein
MARNLSNSKSFVEVGRDRAVDAQAEIASIVKKQDFLIVFAIPLCCTDILKYLGMSGKPCHGFRSHGISAYTTGMPQIVYRPYRRLIRVLLTLCNRTRAHESEAKLGNCTADYLHPSLFPYR